VPSDKLRAQDHSKPESSQDHVKGSQLKITSQ
jgi:hypothetical protein